MTAPVLPGVRELLAHIDTQARAAVQTVASEELPLSGLSEWLVQVPASRSDDMLTLSSTAGAPEESPPAILPRSRSHEDPSVKRRSRKRVTWLELAEEAEASGASSSGFTYHQMVVNGRAGQGVLVNPARSMPPIRSKNARLKTPNNYHIPNDSDAPWCRWCGILDTPEWRMGPHGKRTLCNRCGLRWARESGAAAASGAADAAKRRGAARQGTASQIDGELQPQPAAVLFNLAPTLYRAPAAP